MSQGTQDSGSALPSALVQERRGIAWAWLPPLVAIVVAGYLLRSTLLERGPEITIRVAEGHGLRVGDAMRYRGIDVGRIEELSLAHDLDSVLLRARLAPRAAGIARSGSRFWVVRPQVSFQGVQGLETVVGARYLAIAPGPAGAAPRSEFVALEEAPVEVLGAEGIGLEVVLEATDRFGLSAGAAINYRGTRVGTVLAVGLASDATRVEVRCGIQSRFVQLVRDNTRFWEQGGIELEVALLDGLRADVGSLSSLFLGAVALATPDEPGAPVHNGHRFRLSSGPEEEWLAWAPALPVGAGLTPDGIRLPVPLRAHLGWKDGGLMKRKRTRSGWLVAVPGGLIGPVDLLRAPEGSVAESATLELRGAALPIGEESRWDVGGIMCVAWETSGLETWPGGRLRAADVPEDCLVVGDLAATPRAVSAARLEESEQGWAVDGAISFDPSWHGAAVLSRRDGRLLGLLLVAEGAAHVALVPAKGV